MLIGIVLTAEKETYVINMLAIIGQIMLFHFIPNVIYTIKHRKKERVVLGLIGITPLTAIPYVVLAIIMRIIYV
ncbi:hypothetical protein ACQKJC_18630 [Priestia koreensis]|uniref:hypothetical protein n=1 Tax=Priestia koreensis TaxID=284581 RepID=UPI003D058EE2